MLPRDDTVHAAEISFDDGSTFRREFFSTPQGNAQNLFFNGEKIKSVDFKNRVAKISNGGGELVLNPFAFCALHPREQRTFLTKIFGEMTDVEILNQPQFADLAEMFDGLSADCFIEKCKVELKNPKAEVSGIPWQIAELQRQIDNLPDNADELQTLLAEKKVERDNLRGTKTCDQKRIADLQRDISFYQRQLDDATLRRKSLLKQYHDVEKMPQGLCPTCGQEMPREKFIAERNAKLAQIVAEGKNSAKDIADFKKILSAFEDELKLERAKPVADENRLATLDRDISDLERDLAKVESAAGIKDRIKTLATREKKLNQLIATLEGQIKIAENFQQRKIELVEENISANFEFVRFKLFDYFITTGEIKPTCEAMLDGVPYSALSKGEKLKAALDIFKALQKHFGTDLPLIIDDAESYTQNSFVELPNQIFLCKVSDDDLKITIESR